jgi:hypothetical protein
MQRHPKALVNVAGISVANPRLILPPEVEFAAHIRAAGFCPGRSHFPWGLPGWGSAWLAPEPTMSFSLG